MHVTRFKDAQPYEAPKHHDMKGLRLQGWNVSESEHFWVGFSRFLPGGGAEMDRSALEKVYVVLEGQMTVILDDGQEFTLYPNDSCLLASNEARELVNRSNKTASMLVIMNYPEGYQHERT